MIISSCIVAQLNERTMDFIYIYIYTNELI